MSTSPIRSGTPPVSPGTRCTTRTTTRATCSTTPSPSRPGLCLVRRGRGALGQAESPSLIGIEDAHQDGGRDHADEDGNESAVRAKEPAHEQGDAHAGDDVVDEGHHGRGGREERDVRAELERRRRGRFRPAAALGGKVFGGLGSQGTVIAADVSNTGEEPLVLQGDVHEAHDGEEAEQEHGGQDRTMKGPNASRDWEANPIATSVL